MLNLDLSQKRNLKSTIDNRIKVISRAYEYHISENWPITLNKSLEQELDKAQNTILLQQDGYLKKNYKKLYGRLQAQMGLLIKTSLSNQKQNSEKTKKDMESLVSTEEIQEFYQYKFKSTSNELAETISNTIINQLKKDMSQLQSEIFSKAYYEITEQCQSLYDLKFT